MEDREEKGKEVRCDERWVEEMKNKGSEGGVAGREEDGKEGRKEGRRSNNPNFIATLTICA